MVIEVEYLLFWAILAVALNCNHTVLISVDYHLPI